MDSPLLWFEGVEGFACSTAASPVAVDKHAAAAIVALPTRNRRRDGESNGDEVTGRSSGEARLMVDIDLSSKSAIAGNVNRQRRNVLSVWLAFWTIGAF
jgi:hypothetical protein